MRDPFATIESAHHLTAALRSGLEPDLVAQRFAGRAIVGVVDWVGLNYPHRLSLQGCTFLGPVQAADSRFGNSLDLTDCRFEHGLSLEGSRIDGSLSLERITAQLPTPYTSERDASINLTECRVGQSLFLNQARVRGRVRLVEATVGGRLELVGVQLTGVFNAQSVTIGTDLFCCVDASSAERPMIERGFRLTNATIGGNLLLNGVWIGGDLNLQGGTIRGGLHCTALTTEQPSPYIGGKVWLFRTTVGVQADFRGSTIVGDLNLQYATIGANVLGDCRSWHEPRLDVRGKVWLAGATIAGNVDFSGAKIAGDCNMQSASMGNLLGYSRTADEPRLDVGGKLWLFGLQLRGHMDFSGAMIAGDWCLQNASIGADVACVRREATAPPTNVGGKMLFRSVHIAGNLDLQGAIVAGDLDLQDGSVGNVLCRRISLDVPPPTIEGIALLVGVKVAGVVDFSSSDLRRDLRLHNASIGGHLFCRWSPVAPSPCVVGGDVDLDGAHVGGIISFVGTTVRGHLSAVRTTADDGFYLGRHDPTKPHPSDDPRTTIHGPINLSHAQVNACLSIAGVQCDGALNLHNARIDGDLDAGASPTHVASVAAGNVRVGGNLDCSGILFVRPSEQPSLDLSFAEVLGDCLLPGGETGRGLRLYHAQLGEVRFVDTVGFVVVADGLAFRRLTVPADDFCAFLAQTDPFQKGTYETIERYLRDRGETEQADLVFREMRRRDRRQELPNWASRVDWFLFERDPQRRAERARLQRASTLSWWQRGSQLFFWVCYLFLDITTGYGTRSYRLGLYLIASFLLMWVVFLNPESVRREVHPTAVEMASQPELSERDTHPRNADKDWGPTEAEFAALRTVIPLMGDLPHNEWQPSSKPVRLLGIDWWIKYETLAGLVHALSYIVLPLFVASVTGWLKKRGE